MSGAPVETSLGLEVPAADGALLRTDLQRPRAAGPRPAVLLRTPYGTGSIAMLRFARLLAGLGWAAVFQNVRGRYGSEGRFEPFVHEAEDGASTVRWITRQLWSDGRVLPLGISYSTYTAAALVGEDHGAELLGLISLVAMANPRAHFFEGKAFRLHWALGWAQLIAGERQRPIDVAAMIRHRDASLREMPERLGFPARPWLDWITPEEQRATSWQDLDTTGRLLEHPLPGLHLGGWYDFSLTSTFELHRRMAAAPGAREQQLVVGPWEHNAVFDRLLEGLLAPDALGRGGAGSTDDPTGSRRLARTFLSFLEACRRGVDAPGPAVQVWRSGDGAWSDLEAWPATTSTHRFSLHAREDGGQLEAATRASSPGERAPRVDGQEISLPPDTPPDDGTGELRGQDPASDFKIPTGGRLWTAPGWSLGGPGAAGSESLLRTGGWIALSPPLSDALLLTGRTSLSLGLGSDAERADASESWGDVYGRLVDVAPDGRETWIGDAIHRVPPGERRAELDFGQLHHRLPAGHRLALRLTAGRFPVFDRPPGSRPRRLVLNAQGSCLALEISIENRETETNQVKER